MGPTTLTFTIGALLATAVGIGGLVRASRQRLGWRSIAVGLGAAMAVGAVAAVALVPFGLELFGLVHLAYLGLTVGLPLLGVAVLGLAARRPHGRWAWAVGGALLVPAAVGFYATHVEPNRLRVQQEAVPVAADRAGDDDVRIAVLSDLQTDAVGSYERRAIDRVLATDPDVILVPGDLFQSDEAAFVRALPDLQALLARLRAPGGVFVVQGDVDGRDRVDRAFATNPDARVLGDEVATVAVGDRVLRVGGTRLAYDGAGGDRVRADLAGGPDDGSIRILLSHRPDTVFGLAPSSPVDLTVAGHTHGGQVVLPIVGPIVKLTGVSRTVARGGLHEVDGNRIYVSPGVGMERRQAPQLRFNDPPTIGLLLLTEA